MTLHFSAAFVAVAIFLVACPPDTLARGSAAFMQTTKSSAQTDAEGWVAETGTASYYGPAFHGRLAADGSRFDQYALTAAHSWLPFGTRVKVTLANTRRTVIVTITDRMYSSRRVVDLSVAAARHLGFIDRGLAKVTLAPA
jgi:rare lipoprotein A